MASTNSPRGAVTRNRQQTDSGSSQQAIQRDRRAQSLAAMGLVRREGDRFHVQTAALPDHQESYQVWRDESRRPRCSCREFEELSVAHPVFRCEHILAVKYWLSGSVLVNEEPVKTEPVKTESAEIEPAEIEPAEIEKEEAVGPLVEERELDREIERAPENRGAAGAPTRPIPFTGLLQKLRLPVDSKLIKAREGWTDRQGQTHWVEYVEWHTVADILDRVVPSWSHAVRNITQIGEVVAVTASITIDGVTREGIGTGAADSEMGIKKAEHDALKRAAVKFGIARDLYQRESDVLEQESPTPNFPSDPRAKTVVDLVTPKQL
ncbi:MAG TPA: Rad52/Rad22 family DNA repair protein, partial [Blastocatellia bacterium]|nr:Rad52/Rad22 family DNA repair protein [Blastocatellia bacterium]